MSDTVLVTGGAGFIGSHVVEALLARGDTVRVLDNLSSGKRENLRAVSEAVELIEGDLRDDGTVRRAVAGCDGVAHLAALPSVPQSVEDPLTTHEVNVTGTLGLLLAARDSGCHRMALASSCSVYGEAEESPQHERLLPKPQSPYALSKLACEHYLRLFHELYGMQTVSLRYFNVFGPRQDPSSAYAAVIPKFIDTVAAGHAPTIFGDGEQSRDFVHVSEVARATLLALDAPAGSAGGVFNIANGCAVTINQLADMVKQAMGVEVETIHQPERAGEVKHSLADVSLARNVLNFQPRVSLDEGLQATIQAGAQ